MDKLLSLNTLAKWGVIALAALMISGCQMWEMVSFRWHNASAEVEWQQPERPRAEVPFIMVNNHIIVQARVNQGAPLNFVLDSGAAATVILESDATDALALSKDNRLDISGAGSEGAREAYVVHKLNISLGALAMREMSAIYAPTSSMPFASRDEIYFDGVLGADFFNCCLVEINYDDGVLVFQPRREDLLNQYQDWQRLAMDVSEDTPFITTTAHTRVGKDQVKVMLDTGSTGTLSLFTEAGNSAIPEQTYESISTGISGDSLNLVGLLPGLQLGEHTLQALPTYFRILGSNSQSGSHGVLGNRVLKRFNQVYDFQGKAVYLQKNHTHTGDITADRSGLRMLPHKRGAVVKNIAAETAAALLDLRPGSVVTHIQGEPLAAHNYDRLLGHLRAPTATDVALCWQNDGAQSKCDTLALASRL